MDYQDTRELFDAMEEETQKELDALPRGLFSIPGFDPETGIGYCEKAEHYLVALEVFLNSLEKKVGELESIAEEGRVEDYTLLVHSLKSTARTVGACDLAEKAAELEQAGKRKDREAIRQGNPGLMEIFRQLRGPLLKAIRNEEKAPEKAPEKASGKAPERAPEKPAASAQSLWVFIVDDDSDTLKMASKFLAGAKVRASCAKSGEDAIRFFEQRANEALPQAVLLDVNMPGMDGFETCRRLKELPALRGIPILFLTGDEDEEAEKKGLALGAAAFVRKPFLPEALKEQVLKVLESAGE